MAHVHWLKQLPGYYGPIIDTPSGARGWLIYRCRCGRRERRRLTQALGGI